MIRIDDAIYEVLVANAAEDDRTIFAYTNRLLTTALTNGLSSNGRTVAFEAADSGSSPDEPAKIEAAPMAMGYACCMSKSRRCKHWEFNELEGYWQNTLNGEVVDA